MVERRYHTMVEPFSLNFRMFAVKLVCPKIWKLYVQIVF